MYFPELDVLRFLAFVMVFLCHSLSSFGARVQSSLFLQALDAGGAFSVPIFFALSAFLISGLMMRERENTGTVHLRAFYVRRMLRIWPLYFAALFFCYLVVRVAPRAGHFTSEDLTAYLLFYGNLRSALHYFLPLGGGVLWSLCVEEQFYLIWPAVVKIGGRSAIVIVSILVWVISQIATKRLCDTHGVGGNYVWCNTLTHLQYFSIGALLSAFLYKRKMKIKAALRGLLIACGFILFFLFPGQIKKLNDYYAYFFAGIGVLLVMVGFFGMTLPGWSSPFKYLGKISYGLYIYHIWWIFVILYFYSHFISRAIGTPLFIIQFLVAFPLSVVTAHFSYKFFESPFLRLKERFEIVRSRPV